MQKTCPWIRIAFLIVAIIPLQSRAKEIADNYPPAQTPYFELLESSANHAVIRFENLETDRTLRLNEQVYIGIPPSATYEWNVTGWDLEILDRNTVADRWQDSNQDAMENAQKAKDAATSMIKGEVFAYQELDILRLNLTMPQDITIDDATIAYQKKKVVANSLIIEIHWNETDAPPLSISPSTGHGFNKLFKNLVINSKDIAQLRRKRTLPDSELQQGFHPLPAGYLESVSPINWADGVPAQDSQSIRISVRDTGIVALRPKDLLDRNIDPATIILSNVRIWLEGQEISSYIHDANQNSKFDAEDAIYFYGLESGSEYTNDRPYYLTWKETPEPAKWIAAASAEAVSDTPNQLYARYHNDRNTVLAKISNNYYEWYLHRLDKQTYEYPFQLPNIIPGGKVQIALTVMNKTRSDCAFSANVGNTTEHFQVKFNESSTPYFFVSSDEAIASPTIYIRLDEAPESISALERSTNTKVQAMSRLLLDAIDIIYPKTASQDNEPLTIEKSVVSASQAGFTFSTPLEKPATAWIVGQNELQSALTLAAGTTGFSFPETPWERIVIYSQATEPSPHTVDRNYPSTLHQTDQGYDYVMIAYHPHLEAAKRLAAHRTQDGFRVLLTDVQDIYDEFNDGYPDPKAIKRFLRYGQSKWKGLSPEFLCIVGESSWDHRNFEGYDIVDQIPTYTPPNDPQHFGSDEWYAYLWDENDAKFSDVIVGRISVYTPEDASNYISKVIEYETATPVGPWKSENLFIADDTFERYCEETAQESLPAAIEPETLYQDNFSVETNPYLYKNFYGNPDPEAQEYLNKKYSPEGTYALIDKLNQGSLLVQYFGHGGAQLWSHERLFYATNRPTSNLLEMDPTNRFPFILNWSCLTGYLNINMPPFNICLAEEFIRHPDRGSIVVWAPSENGTTDQHIIMSHLVVRSLIQDGLSRMGEAVTFTKTEYLQTNYNLSLMKQYILFGDPAVKLQVPKETLDIEYQPKTYHLGSPQTFDVKTESKTVREGQAIVSFSIGAKNVYQSKPFPILNGIIQHQFTIETTDDTSNIGKARIYAWNDRTQNDAWGGMDIPRYAPELEIQNATAVIENEQIVLTFDLQNVSGFEIPEVDCLLSIGEASYTIQAENLEPHSTRSLRWEGKPEPSSPIALLQIQNDESNSFQLNETKATATIVLPSMVRDEIVPILNLVTTDPPETVASNLTRLQVPLMNLSTDKVLAATATLTGPGSATSHKFVSLNPRQERRMVFNFTPTEAGTSEYEIHVHTKSNHTFQIPLTVLERPDIALAEGDIRYEPATPVIGKRVYFHTTVYNVGEAPARNIMVTAFNGDPENNQRLTAFNNQSNQRIPYLGPGESKEIEITWDPYGYDGLGTHEIYIVADPYNRIEESNEENNRSVTTITFNNLPDLTVNPWSDHKMKLVHPTAIPVWGQPIQLSARVSNQGNSEADHVRLTLFYNRDESSHFFSKIPPGGVAETHFEVPLLSAKNTLSVAADKYNLIGETSDLDGNDNNQSNEKRAYFTLQMPETPIENGLRVYPVTNETYFTAGQGEYLYYDRKNKQLTIHPNIEHARIHLIPTYVLNPDAFTLGSMSNKWQWNIPYNIFCSPTTSEEPLRVEVPAPNGNFDVYLRIFSPPAYAEGKKQPIQIKTPSDQEFVVYDFGKTDDPESFQFLNNFNISNGHFLIELKAVTGGYFNNVGDLLFVRSTKSKDPVMADYLSAYYPATGSGAGAAVMNWDAVIPEHTAIKVKARWVNKNPDGSLKFLPWAKIAKGEDGSLKLPGKGDYFQYALELYREDFSDAAPAIRSIEIQIPCKG